MQPARESDPARDRELRAVAYWNRSARDAAGSPLRVMMRRLHFAFFVALIATGAVSAKGAAPGSVTGVVRDSAGVPQIGATVQLLQPGLNVISVAYTDDRGQFFFPYLEPGRYALKAMATSFLPSLREDVRVLRHGTVVNLTLNTLYEVMQWLPTQPKAANAQKDDWKWTLRSAANRPLLRWLEDGPLVVVSDGSGSHPKLKARIMATGAEGTFGESGERLTAAVEDTPSDSRELLAHVDFAPGTDGAMESMLGFRQDLGFAGSVQSVAAIALHPDIDSNGAAGLDEATVRSSETMNLGDTIEGEAGAQQVVARFGSGSPNTAFAALPFASVGWKAGEAEIHYRMTTIIPAWPEAEGTGTVLNQPRVAMRNRRLVFERGLHQEIGWQRQADGSQLAVLVFNDHIENSVVEAAAHGATGVDSADAIYDRTSDLVHLTGPDFASTGVAASFEQRLPNGNLVRLSYANGNALAMPVSAHAIAGALRPRRIQTYSLTLSGTLEGTGTKWRASYRWQPEDAVTQLAPFAVKAEAPYLNLHVRQPICAHHDGTSGIDALLDVQNMLAQGYRPIVMSDGSLLIFAADQRAIRAGLAFTF